MIPDLQASYSWFQAVTSGATASTNSLYKPAGSLGFGPGGRRNFLVVQIPVAFTGGTNITFAWQGDDNSAFSSPATLDSRVIVTATLVQGYSYSVAVPDSGVEAWTRMLYTPSGTYSAGQINAFLTDQTDGFNVVVLP